MTFGVGKVGCRIPKNLCVLQKTKKSNQDSAQLLRRNGSARPDQLLSRASTSEMPTSTSKTSQVTRIAQAVYESKLPATATFDVAHAASSLHKFAREFLQNLRAWSQIGDETFIFSLPKRQ